MPTPRPNSAPACAEISDVVPRSARLPDAFRTSARPVALALLLLLLAFAATLAVLARTPRPPMRIAINTWAAFEFAYLAQEKGFFRDEGLDLRLVEMGTLGDCRRAFERAQADAMFASLAEVLIAREQGERDPRIVLVTDATDGADVIVAKPPALSIPDLRGKRIAVEEGSFTIVLLSRALELAGMSLADVKTVSMPVMNMVDALRRGEIDAAVCYPPYSLDALDSGAATKVFDSSRLPGEIIDVVAVDADFARVRMKDAAAFVRAFHRAQDYAREHPAESFAIMAAREHIPPDVFADILTNGIRVFTRDDQARFLGPGGSLAASTAAMDRALRATGQLTRPSKPEKALSLVEEP